MLGGEDIEGRRVRPALVTGAGPGVELIDEEPPITLPRGQASRRPPRCGSGSDQ